MNGLVEITVTDRGLGIAPEHQERVFARLFRVDQARSRSIGGTGLGLAIVKHVAANHGGDVQLWSKPGTGSTFTLGIPAHPDSPHNISRARHQHSSTRDGRDDLVLIAEGSGSIADMLTFLLNKEASSRIDGKQRTTISPW